LGLSDWGSVWTIVIQACTLTVVVNTVDISNLSIEVSVKGSAESGIPRNGSGNLAVGVEVMIRRVKANIKQKA
jgi:hypothetical protein